MRLLALAAASAALLAAPAMAEAKTWRGKTRQGQPVAVLTRSDDGLVRAVRIGYEARCSDGKGFTRGIRFVRPFDALTANAFQDAGVIKWRFTESGERARGRVSIDGGLRSSGRWTGNLRLRVKIRRNGHVIATCRSGRVGWKARPR